MYFRLDPPKLSAEPVPLQQSDKEREEKKNRRKEASFAYLAHETRSLPKVAFFI